MKKKKKKPKKRKVNRGRMCDRFLLDEPKRRKEKLIRDCMPAPEGLTAGNFSFSWGRLSPFPSNRSNGW